MKASLFYRIAAVLLVLFAVAHTFGFRQIDPKWGVNELVGSMQSLHFDAMGASRTYWDFFLGSGFTIGVFFLFSAILAWGMSRLPATTLANMRGTAWAFALCFAAITFLSCIYLFIIPIVFSTLITLCLTAAARISANSGPQRS